MKDVSNTGRELLGSVAADAPALPYGRAHAERRAAQAAAARKHTNRKRAIKRPGKGSRNNWKRDN